MTIRDDRFTRYSHKLIELDRLGKLGLWPQGPYGFRVTSGPFTVDYWPGRGTWRSPDGKRDGKGWNSLMRHLELYGEIEGQSPESLQDAALNANPKKPHPFA